MIAFVTSALARFSTFGTSVVLRVAPLLLHPVARVLDVRLSKIVGVHLPIEDLVTVDTLPFVLVATVRVLAHLGRDHAQVAVLVFAFLVLRVQVAVLVLVVLVVRDLLVVFRVGHHHVVLRCRRVVEFTFAHRGHRVARFIDSHVLGLAPGSAVLDQLCPLQVVLVRRTHEQVVTSVDLLPVQHIFTLCRSLDRLRRDRLRRDRLRRQLLFTFIMSFFFSQRHVRHVRVDIAFAHDLLVGSIDLIFFLSPVDLRVQLVLVLDVAQAFQSLLISAKPTKRTSRSPPPFRAVHFLEGVQGDLVGRPDVPVLVHGAHPKCPWIPRLSVHDGLRLASRVVGE